MVLDTLAAAQASRGRLPEAVETQQKAIEAAKGTPMLSLGARSTTLEAMRQRLETYKAGRPYLEPLNFKGYQPARPTRR